MLSAVLSNFRYGIAIFLTCLLSACQTTSELQGVNNQDPYGWSPLHMVVSSQYLKEDNESAEMVKLIISKGGETELTNTVGDTPLVVAVNNNKPLAIEALLQAKADINSNANNARSPLMRAVFLNNLARVKQLLSHQANVNLVSDQGWSVLHIASSKLIEKNDDALQVIKLVIEAGANIEANNDDQCTPLILAVLNNKAGMTQQLLDAQANVNARDKNGWTPLMHAVANGNQSIIDMLLDHQANIHLTTHEGWSVLHMITSPLETLSDAVKAKIAHHLIKAGALVNAKNQRGRTPLHFSASTGLVETLGLLIQSGAHIEQGDQYGWTPLMRAVHLVQEASMGALIDLGAQINTPDNKGWTALHHAATPVRQKESAEAQFQRNQDAIKTIEKNITPLSFTQATQENPYLKIIHKLIENGADIEARTHNERTPLYVAVSYQELLTSAALLHLGSRVDAYAYNEWTPLYRAISAGNIELVKLLLSHQASVNHKTQKLGWGALLMTTNDAHKADDNAQAQIVPLLVQAGSDITAVSSTGLTASMNAAINGKLAVLKALVASGADIDAVNPQEDNKTALEYALKNQHLDIVSFIKSLSD